MTTLEKQVDVIEQLANEGLITSITIDITGIGLSFYDLVSERVGGKIEVRNVRKVNK